jgi:hypothetical protein
MTKCVRREESGQNNSEHLAEDFQLLDRRMGRNKNPVIAKQKTALGNWNLKLRPS